MPARCHTSAETHSSGISHDSGEGNVRVGEMGNS